VTISSNVAGGSFDFGFGAGGGIFHTDDPLTLVNSTVAANQASGPNGIGGGNIDSGFDLRLENTIVANGTMPDRITGPDNCASDTGSPAAFATLGHNLEARPGQAGSQCGLSPGVSGDLTSTDAKLGILAMNGGPTPTHELLFASPAIDAAGPNGPATDQRGVARPQGSRCDIGAFERNSAPMPGYTCAGPPAPAPAAAATGGATPASKKCKKKKKKSRAARKRCKKKRR
jgi:hypothetical protein